MSIDTDIDDELRRLFDNLDGDRLDIQVRPDADRVILAGARRVRRRRYVVATASAVAVAVLIGGGIAVAANASRNSLPPAETTVEETVTQDQAAATTTNPPRARPAAPASPKRQGTPRPRPEPPAAEPPRPGTTEKPPPPSLTDGVLTATGYGPFQLGMSTDDALATGLLTLKEHGGSCVRYAINGGGRLLVSAQLGVTGIDVPDRVRTPEGLGVGSTVGEVRAAYPWATDDPTGLTAGTTGEGSAAYYAFHTVEAPPAAVPVPDEFVVGDLRLAANGNDCALAF